MGWEWVREALEKLQGVEPYEVSQVLAAERRWPRPAIGLGGVRVLVIYGRTHTGRPLRVVVKHKEGRDWWIVGARELRADEVAELESWEARGE
ncbi:MAG TPA: hypothetical protein VFP72_02965 [Kineosporiaceae bacterium]|nr:hypothetical protein [Kineosporiaceae bacterium]